MIKIDFELLKEEIICMLSREKTIVLATSYKDKVTARTMCHVNDGLTIYIQTNGNSEKTTQLKGNPKIALAISSMQIEACAEIIGNPFDTVNREFITLYKDKYPQYFETYSSLPNEIVIKAIPTKITLFKYIDGKPCMDILDIERKISFRTVVE